jgi:hypothetical protein
VWRVYPVEGCHCAQWLMGLWSTQVKMEGIVLKAAWHWRSDCSVIKGGFTHTMLFKCRSAKALDCVFPI